MNLPLYEVGLSRVIIQARLKKGDSAHASEPQDFGEDDIAMKVADELDVRKALIPRPGYVFVGADYSQQELRAFAELSGEPSLIEIFETNADPHAEAASAIATAPPKEDAQAYFAFRCIGKLCNFLLIFGGAWKRYYDTADYDMLIEDEIELAESKKGAKATSQQRAKFRAARKAHYAAEAKRHVEAYHNRFRGIRPFHKTIERVGRARGYIAYKYGRRRRIPPHVWASKWFNFIIQGSCADLLRDRLIAIAHAIEERKLDAYILWPTHDDILFEVKEEQAHALEALAKDVMSKSPQWKTIFPLDTKIMKEHLEK
jgi:DNA polymerase-1